MRAAPPRMRAADSRHVAPPPKRADPHYLSAEHQAWRAGVMKRAGGRCQQCGRSGCRLFADHIVELRDGGAGLDPANGQALCGSCHSAKTYAARGARTRV
jgi:5-methylcytosine-specific restriction protein A